jgi:hypothetical protein
VLTKHCGHRSCLLAGVVTVKVHHCPVLGRSSEAMEVVNIPHRLEVATANKEINRLAALLFDVLYCGVDGVQLPMPTAIDCHLHAAVDQRTSAQQIK